MAKAVRDRWWHDIPIRAWIVSVGMVVGAVVSFWWEDTGAVIVGGAWIVGLGMTVLDIGRWPIDNEKPSAAAGRQVDEQ